MGDVACLYDLMESCDYKSSIVIKVLNFMLLKSFEEQELLHQEVVGVYKNMYTGPSFLGRYARSERYNKLGLTASA